MLPSHQLFILWISCAIIANKSQTYCIWGRAGALTNTFINGEWVYASTDSYGNPYYIKPYVKDHPLVTQTIYIMTAHIGKLVAPYLEVQMHDVWLHQI